MKNFIESVKPHLINDQGYFRLVAIAIMLPLAPLPVPGPFAMVAYNVGRWVTKREKK